MRENIGWGVIGLALGGMLGGLAVNSLEPNPHAWMLVSVMITGGLLGGGVNYFIARTDNAEKASLLTSLAVGVGAALLVPLFLNVLASDLLKSTRDEPLFVLIFLGFCVLAGISSRAFITTISDRVLRKVEEVEEKAEQAQRAAAEAQAEVRPLVARQTEPEAGAPEVTAGDEEGAADEFAETRGSSGSVSDEERLLEALDAGHYALRSLGSLSEQLSLPPQTMRTLLYDLMRRGLVGQRRHGNDASDRWYITGEGIRVVLSRRGPERAAGRPQL